MPIDIVEIIDAQVEIILGTDEGTFADLKDIEIAPAKLTRTISAFANTDGGDLYIGIAELKLRKARSWVGFENQEAANGHLQAFEALFPLGTNFQYGFLKSSAHPGLVLHVHVNKTHSVVSASNNKAYRRVGAQNIPVTTSEELRRLEYSKGIATFESEPLNASKEVVTQSEIIKAFIKQVVPTAEPESWLTKQALLRDEKPTVAGVLLFADVPQAVLPKRSGIKVYQYKTQDREGSREALAFQPITVEGCLYEQIQEAERLTVEIIERIPKLGAESLEPIKYPQETLHEIITNAVIHRDYSVADDVHVRVFENRIEVQSPGRLPGHITVENILNERFARNGSIVRILNKFPDPPNKDVGEGLNTAFDAMHQLGLKEPVISELENAVLVVIRHEPLASPEQTILEYLDNHDTIGNAEARRITHVRADYRMKAIFGRMVAKGMIEQVPGTRTSNTAYRKPKLRTTGSEGSDDSPLFNQPDEQPRSRTVGGRE